jgi:SPOR domain
LKIISFHFFLIINNKTMKQITLALAFAGLIASQTTAQKTQATDQLSAFYTVQLGNFDDNVKQADFEAIRSYAYVYKKDGIVFIGGFNSDEAAEPLLAKIKAKGYDDAFVAARSYKKAQNVHIIQLATKNAGENINWRTYAKVGDLFSMPNGNQVRIVHGYYTDLNDARVKLKEITNMGFADAFVKTVRDVQLSPVTDFDTGDKSFLAQPTEVEEAPEVNTKGVPTEYRYTGVKRKSAIKLQEALREIGTYGGAVDGQFGKGTAAAYDKSLKINRRLKSYGDMAKQYQGFKGWEDVRLLITIGRDLNIKDDVNPVTDDLLSNLPDEALSTKEAQKVLDWHSNTWKSLEKWSATSQYNDQVYIGLKVAYYRSLLHLEDHFASKGIKGESATALAASVLKTLIGEDLDSFN